MKKRLLSIILVCTLIMLPKNVFALTNKNGVEMTDEQYNRLVNVYGQISVDNMSQEIFDIEKNLILTPISTKTVYIETKYGTDSFGNVLQIEENEISKEEYDNARPPIVTFASCGVYDMCWETDYKKLSITAYGVDTPGVVGSTATKMVITNTWKIMPKVRSYDIMAFRYYNWTPDPNSAWGQLTYAVNTGGSTAQNYSTASSGYNAPYGGSVGGFGISMKLPTSTSVISLSSQLSINGNSTNTIHAVYGTYQHATKEIQEAVSKEYLIGAGGYGNVIKFKTANIASYYDNMQGVIMGYY